MSDSLRPHRRQPTRLHHPWDSPGKNTGVGCHFLLQCMKVKSENEVAQSSLTLATPWTAAHQAPLSMGFSRQKYWSGVSFRYRVRLFILLFSCFLRYVYIAMNFTLSTAFTVCHRFWVVVFSFSFSFISMHILISFLISSVICLLFSSVLFSLHMLEFLIVFIL